MGNVSEKRYRGINREGMVNGGGWFRWGEINRN